MREPSGRRSAIFGFWTLSILLSLAAIAFLVVNEIQQDEVFTPHALMGPGYATVGAIILMRRHHRIGVLFLSFGLFVAAVGALFQTCVWAETHRELPMCSGEVPLADSLWPASYVFFGWLLLLFPTGRLPSKRWLPVVSIFAGTWSVLVVGPIFGLGDEVGILSPIAVGALVAVATAPIFRIRNSSAIERLQMRYLSFVLVLCLVIALLGPILSGIGLGSVAGPFVGLVLFAAAALGIPVAVGIAITRHRLYEIDVVVNRTLVYAVLTSILALVYAGTVVALQALVAPFAAESDLAVAGSTLLVAALFRPLRVRVQTFIDRRFYRSKFNAQKTVEEFNADLRDEVDLSAVTDRLVLVVRDTLQPAHVSVWMRSGS